MNNPTYEQHEQHIRRCIKLAQQALEAGDNPFGSVIVNSRDIVVTEAKNQIAEHDITRHAEIMAMRAAQKKLQTDDLSDCVIYSNCEPCPMCSFMIRELKFNTVVFALTSPHMGGYSKWNILEEPGLQKFEPVFSMPPTVIAGVLETQARETFEQAGWTTMFN